MVSAICIIPIYDDIISYCNTLANSLKTSINLVLVYIAWEGCAHWHPQVSIPTKRCTKSGQFAGLLVWLMIKEWTGTIHYCENLAPFNLCRVSSTNFAEWHGCIIHLLRHVRSRHSLIFPLGFFTHTKEFSHSIGSLISTLCSIHSLQSLSNSAFKRLLHCMGYTPYRLGMRYSTLA